MTDYRFSHLRKTERFSRIRGMGLGTFTPLTRPISLTLSSAGQAYLRSVATEILTAETPEDRVRIDNQMWTVDARWMASAEFKSMRACIRVPEVGGGVRVTPWYDLASPTDCRNVDGRVFEQPSCDWGYWQLGSCSIETATQYAFQFQRYLWAQGRLRELVRRKPVKGVTPAQDAADWVWKACQFISVMLWSTNVRFNDTGARVVSYSGDLVEAGLLFSPWAYMPNLGPDGYASFPLGAVIPRIFNNMTGDLDSQRVIPTEQDSFSPGAGPLDFMLPRTDVPSWAAGGLTKAIGYLMPDGSVRQIYSDSYPGLSAEQITSIKRDANALYSASGKIDALRWASARAFLNWSFRTTWGWGDDWQTLPGVRFVRGVGQYGTRNVNWDVTNAAPVAIGGAGVTFDFIAAQAEHYASPDVMYTKWLERAANTYGVETAGTATASDRASADFLEARQQMISSLAQAASLELTQRSTGYTYTTLAVSALSSILTLIGGVAGTVGIMLSAFLQGVDALATAFGITLSSRSPSCPAFPFMRIMKMTPGCDLTMTDITSSLLGIDSDARWPVSVGGQTRTFSVDGKQFTARFESSDTTADAVKNRINAAAALVGLATVATVVDGQVHVEGRDPSKGRVRSSGGATALNFPGGSTMPTFTFVPQTARPVTTLAAPNHSGLGIVAAIGAAALAAWAYVRSKKNDATMEGS